MDKVKQKLGELSNWLNYHTDPKQMTLEEYREFLIRVRDEIQSRLDAVQDDLKEG